MLSKSHVCLSVWSACPNLLVLDRDLVRAVAVAHLCGIAVRASRLSPAEGSSVYKVGRGGMWYDSMVACWARVVAR